MLLPDGRVRWIAEQGEVRRDERGQANLMTGVSTDVTERRMAEERLGDRRTGWSRSGVWPAAWLTRPITR